MSEGKTIGQLMEEMRAKAGAQNYHGHGYMDLQRFAEDTRHMIIFDVLTNDSPVGWKGERTRLFLSDTGYEKALDSQEKGQIKILSHAKVRQGNLHYDRSDQLRYCALIGYIHYEAPVEEQNFSTLIEFINAMEVREDDEEFKNPVDLMFDALESEKPNHFAVRQYKKYKLAAGDICSK